MNLIPKILIFAASAKNVFQKTPKIRKRCESCHNPYCEQPCYVGITCGACQREECKAEDQEANT